MKLFFITGEDSGDALAAPLISALKAKHGDDLECLGVGGPMMKEVGFNELLPMDQISVIGILEVLPQIPRLLKIKKAMVEEIEAQQPDAVITVDFPDFNFMIAKELRKRGVYKGKLIHYVAPSVWAWRPGRAAKIAKFMDGMMCLFPMEIDYFTKHGMRAEHVGHPLVSTGAHKANGDEFRKANEIPDNVKTIGLFFGSRLGEFKRLAPVLKDTLRYISDVEEDVHIIAPTLPKLEYNVRKLLEDMKVPAYVNANPDLKWQAFKSCDIALAVSGTVALELAYAGVPHIIAYKVNPITEIILRILVKVKHAHLANILLDKAVVPECLQGKCNPGYIAQQAIDLLQDEDQKNEQRAAFKDLHSLLGESYDETPSERAANFIDSVIKP